MKKSSLFIFALTFLVASAFTFIKKDAPKKDPTYYYVLDEEGDPTEPADYGPPLAEPPDGCDGDTYVCVIIAEDNDGYPDIDEGLEGEIETALLVHEDQSHVFLTD